MSDVGLASGVYDDLRKIGNLVDDLLVSLRAGTAAADQCDAIAGLLLSVGTPDTPSTGTLRLTNVLRRSGESLDTWMTLGEKLRKQAPANQLIPRLETLADLIETVATDRLRRLRGHHR